MNEVRWMAAAGVGSWIAATAAGGGQAGAEVLLGMLGPLAAVIVKVPGFGPQPVFGSIVEKSNVPW